MTRKNDVLRMAGPFRFRWAVTWVVGGRFRQKRFWWRVNASDHLVNHWDENAEMFDLRKELDVPR